MSNKSIRGIGQIVRRVNSVRNFSAPRKLYIVICLEIEFEGNKNRKDLYVGPNIKYISGFLKILS